MWGCPELPPKKEQSAVPGPPQHQGRQQSGFEVSGALHTPVFLHFAPLFLLMLLALVVFVHQFIFKVVFLILSLKLCENLMSFDSEDLLRIHTDQKSMI